MALDDNGFRYVKSLPGIFKVVIIICSLCAFICAMIVGGSWQWEGVAFFNILQLIILVYGIAVLVIRLTNMLNVNWWKFDAIMSVMLACLEFAATSIFANPSGDALTAMVVFGYTTGIICVVNVSYIILKV